MSEWKSITLGQLSKDKQIEIRTGPFGSQLHQSDYVDDGVPVVMPKDIVDWNICTDTIARTSSEMVEKLRIHQLRSGDIVYGRRGDIGRHAFVSENEAGWLCGTGCIRLRLLNDAPIIPRFLSFFLRLPDTINSIYNQAVGSTMPNLNTGIIENIVVNYPDVDTQKKIVGALCTYDDLIENNNRRIAILEEMAQKLYREWFVHFRFPGYENVKMAQSEMGLIPEGWTAGSVRDLLDYSRGKSYSSQDINGESGMPFINLKNIQAYGGFRNDGTKTFSGKFKANQVVKNKDIVMAITDMTQERRLVGQVAQISNISDYAVISMDLIKLIPHDVRTTDYIYAMFRYSGISAKISDFANGANVLHLNPEVVKQQPCVVPKAEVMIMFQKYISEMLKMAEEVSAQNINLRKTRDLLLPRLISGDIDVSELDIPIKEG